MDIFILGTTIGRIAPTGSIPSSDSLIGRLIDCKGLRAFPGIIDQHMHILGGGGEQGFASRLPTLTVEEITGCGITTLIGLLGADGITRNLVDLYAQAKLLEAQGLTTYLYSGSYALPPVTFTGSITKDLLLIDKVIGAGEIAISDHRASPFPFETLQKLAADVHLGGLLSGKAGVLHLHVGDGKSGLAPVKQLLESTDLPPEQFVPTHANRNPSLFEEAVQFCLCGGHIDLTAGETAGVAVPDGIRVLSERGANLNNVTVSSDAGGSIPGGGCARARVLFDDIVGCIRTGIPVENAFRLVTENVARLLKLYPKKGVLAEGSDADILITDGNFDIKLLFCMGRAIVEKF